MNTYKTSTGERLTQSQIDRKINECKRDFLQDFRDEHGYYFCEECKISSGTMLDCSHNISVKESKESGRTELCFDKNNLTLLCRTCHQKKDGLNIDYDF